MVQQQLVDYIKSQLQLGVSREALKPSLLAAGWAGTDVEDSLKSVEPKTGAGPVVERPQTIMVSDLLVGSPMGETGAAGKKDVKGKEKAPTELPEKIKQLGKMPVVSHGKPPVVLIALAALAILSAGGAVFFYLQNNNIKGQIASYSAQSAAANAKVNDLTSQLGKLASDSNSRIAAITAESDKLSRELYFFVVPAGFSSSTPEADFSLRGILSGSGRIPYVVTTADGLKVSVKNSKDPKVDAMLNPLISKTIEISGTHVVGSRDVTVTAVSGSSTVTVSSSSVP